MSSFGDKCVWFEFDLPKEFKDIIQRVREKYLSKYRTKHWRKDRLHTTLIYCGDNLGYGVKELNAMLDCVTYAPTVKISDFKRGDYGIVRFITLEEVCGDDMNDNDAMENMMKAVESGKSEKVELNCGTKHSIDFEDVSPNNNLQNVFRNIYKIATSKGRKIEMKGHDDGKHYPVPLHITVFFPSTDVVVDPEDMKKAKDALFEELQEVGMEFTFPSVRIMSDNPRTGKTYIMCEKKFNKNKK